MKDHCETYDYVIIGAGFYGLFAAYFLSRHDMKVAVIECDDKPFSRASAINQARVHYGYHYPRSLATAKKTQIYFDRFHDEFGFAIHQKFEKIYAIAKSFSYTSPMQFEKFCAHANIPCTPISVSDYCDTTHVQAAYKTSEHTYDATILADHLMAHLQKSKTQFYFNNRVDHVEMGADDFTLTLQDGTIIKTPRVLNATFAAMNQVNKIFDQPPEKIKYELCEVILVRSNDVLRDLGITVMDGPFFSVMPYGKTGLHSLTAVSYTPHYTSKDSVPLFPCQKHNAQCTAQTLQNCNTCPARPKTSWNHMAQLARTYLQQSLGFEYEQSLYAIKPILQDSEIDDRRPTLVREHLKKPVYRSVLSGKINTVFDLEQELSHDIQN